MGLGKRAQLLWPGDSVSPWNVGHSQGRDRTLSPALAGEFLTAIKITGKPVSTLFLIACGSYVLLLVETMNCPSELYTFQLQPVEESLPAFPLQH